MDSITATLARFVIDTRSADIPDAVLAGARNALIDTIGVALAGTGERVSESRGAGCSTQAPQPGQVYGDAMRAAQPPTPHLQTVWRVMHWILTTVSRVCAAIQVRR